MRRYRVQIYIPLEFSIKVYHFRQNLVQYFKFDLKVCQHLAYYSAEKNPEIISHEIKLTRLIQGYNSERESKVSSVS